MSDLVLGVDMGTGSSKALLVRPDGEVVATAKRAHEVSYPRPGWVELDAERVWWDEVAELCRELVAQVPAGDRIAAMCVSGVGPCLLLCDEDDRPLRPAILYGVDTRATAEIEELTGRYGAERVVHRGGSALSTQAVGPKMRWVARHEPEVWERTARWYASSSFVVARLTGEHVLDHHTASQCDPLYDLAAQDWARDWYADIAPAGEPPRLAWPSEVVGTVTAAAATVTGLPAGTPVCAGTVDAWAEAYSVGARTPGDLMLMYGSTMFLIQVLPGPTCHELLWVTSGVEPHTFTLAAGMSTSGSLTAWIRRLTGGAPFEELVGEAAAVPPGSDGLVLLPYFAGERSPIFDPRARGVIAGLSLRHGRGHLYRAAYEGVAYGIRHIVEHMDAAGGPASRVLAVGGGTQGGLWTQIVSDVTGREQLLPQQTIGASYGDALLAAVGAGLVPHDTDWTRVAGVVRPRPEAHAVYDELYRTYRELYPATREQVHRLARLQEDAGLPVLPRG